MCPGYLGIFTYNARLDWVYHYTRINSNTDKLLPKFIRIHGSTALIAFLHKMKFGWCSILTQIYKVIHCAKKKLLVCYYNNSPQNHASKRALILFLIKLKNSRKEIRFSQVFFNIFVLTVFNKAPLVFFNHIYPSEVLRQAAKVL
jgi:hypothetical protein